MVSMARSDSRAIARVCAPGVGVHRYTPRTGARTWSSRIQRESREPRLASNAMRCSRGGISGSRATIVPAPEKGFAGWRRRARQAARPREGSLVEARGERARLYDSRLFRNQVAAEFSETLLWPGPGLPAEMNVLLAAGIFAFVNNGERVVAHGGISIEEVLVPFVRFSRE